MLRLRGICALSIALLLATGCENQTTTTGPAPATTSGKTKVKKLTLKAAGQQTIKQGDTDEVAIKIDRDNFDDAVTLHLNDLPKGITSQEQELVIPTGSSSTKFTLKAAPDAAVGEHDVKIDAKAPGVDENVQIFKLTVKQK